jgi:iron(III) transport system ATP-binding protein
MNPAQCPLSPAPASVLLELDRVSHRYGDHSAVRGLSLRLQQGKIGCLLGPSGCGKTTVLRCIAGFEPIGEGEIVLGGQVVSRRGHTLPPEQRHVGMVFQDYALFPHLTVAGNIAFGLGRWPRAERQQRIAHLLGVVGLADAGSKYPHELSGGQQQRVALARALAPCPQLLLLDEPFSSLDVELRERLGQEVREILKQQNITAILVTHDQHEAFAMADEIGVMHEGEIQQWDTAYNLYHRPANRFVADFVGEGVLIPGTVIGPGRVQTELGALHGDIPGECAPGCAVDVLLRPDDIVHDDHHGPMQATIAAKAFRGADILYTLLLPSGRKVLSLVPSHHDHSLGEKIGIRPEVDHVVAFLKTEG